MTNKYEELTVRMYGLIRYVRGYRVHVTLLRKIDQRTLYACLLPKRAYFTKDSKGFIEVSNSGEKAYQDYHTARAPERKIDADLTDRVARMLRVSRIIQMRKVS